MANCYCCNTEVEDWEHISPCCNCGQCVCAKCLFSARNPGYPKISQNTCASCYEESTDYGYIVFDRMTPTTSEPCQVCEEKIKKIQKEVAKKIINKVIKNLYSF